MPKPTPQDFITWTNTLVQFPWPIQLNDFPPYAKQLGWTPTPLPDEFSVCDDSDVDDMTLGTISSEEICDLSHVMARNETEDADGAAKLNDVFVSYVAALKKEWGGPFPARSRKGTSRVLAAPRGHVRSSDRRVYGYSVPVHHASGMVVFRLSSK